MTETPAFDVIKEVIIGGMFLLLDEFLIKLQSHKTFPFLLRTQNRHRLSQIPEQNPVNHHPIWQNR